MKGIAIAAAEVSAAGAASYNASRTSLTFQPAFRHANRTKPLIAFYLSRHRWGWLAGAQPSMLLAPAASVACAWAACVGCV